MNTYTEDIEVNEKSIGWREWRRGALLVFKCKVCNSEVTEHPDDLVPGEVLDVRCKDCEMHDDMMFSHIIVAPK